MFFVSSRVLIFSLTVVYQFLESQDAFYAMLTDEEKTALAAAHNSKTSATAPGSSREGSPAGANQDAGAKMSDMSEKERLQKLQDDMMQMQVIFFDRLLTPFKQARRLGCNLKLKYQKELERLEKENKELRKQVMLKNDKFDNRRHMKVGSEKVETTARELI